MKKILTILFVLLGTVLFTENLLAQNPIPSYDVPIINDPTVFEEVVLPLCTSFNCTNLSLLAPNNREEKKLGLMVTDRDNSINSWVVIEVYSLDGGVAYGPFTVIEGVLFEMALSTSLTWGVRVTDSSEGSIVDVWFD
jgi:hypothetical protein